MPVGTLHSSLATQITPATIDKIHRRVPWGLLVHTTGRGVCAKAQKTGTTPVAVALDIYARSQDGRLHPYKWGGPTYVLDHDGALYQLAPDDIVTYHAGGGERDEYLNGSWIHRCSPKIVAAWHRAWPAYKSPQHLYPHASANTDYVGLEMIPCGSGFGMPMRAGLLFTREQHDRVVDLGRDLGQRHGWPGRWWRTPRLLGHEDVQPIDRDKGGGWDPGWLREAPYFDFEYVRVGFDPAIPNP